VQQNVAAAEKIAKLLQDRAELKALVCRLFKNVASVTPDPEHLDPRGLRCFRALFTHNLNLPEEAFGDLLTDYVRFDFDGNGRLDVTETYKLVKFHLWEYTKQLGSGGAQVNIPCMTLQGAGYKVSKELGKGNQAVVQLATDRDGNARCIKCYDKSKVSAVGLDMLKEEFEAMKLVGCQALAQTFEIFQDAQYYYMVNEVYYGGDFTTLRPRAEKQGVDMTEDWWRSIFRQCFRALDFMHQQAMIHCDIKEPNLMLKTDNIFEPEVVIVDFGLAKAMGVKDTGVFGGTPGYIPPETLKHKKWFPRGDIFSLGVVMFQMLTDRLPEYRLTPTNKGLFLQGCKTLEDVQQATISRQAPFHDLPRYPGLVPLVAKLLEKQLSLRLSGPQALTDAWITGSASSIDDQFSDFDGESSPFRSNHPLATIGDLTAVMESMSDDDEDSSDDEENPEYGGNLEEKQTPAAAKEVAVEEKQREGSEMKSSRSSTAVSAQQHVEKEKEIAKEKNQVPSRPEPVTPGRISISEGLVSGLKALYERMSGRQGHSDGKEGQANGSKRQQDRGEGPKKITAAPASEERRAGEDHRRVIENHRGSSSASAALEPAKPAPAPPTPVAVPKIAIGQPPARSPTPSRSCAESSRPRAEPSPPPRPPTPGAAPPQSFRDPTPGPRVVRTIVRTVGQPPTRAMSPSPRDGRQSTPRPAQSTSRQPDLQRSPSTTTTTRAGAQTPCTVRIIRMSAPAVVPGRHAGFVSPGCQTARDPSRSRVIKYADSCQTARACTKA
jgi:serine/threonine protein kinase